MYKVHLVRDGGNYCTRSVTVTQIAEKGTCFTCTCSFKRAETSPIDYQEKVDIEQRYKVALEGKDKFDHPDAPSQDSIWYVGSCLGLQDLFIFVEAVLISR